MTKLIHVVVSPRGETKVETQGFAGESCREASAFIEGALGQRNSEELTPEFYHPVTTEQRQQNEAY